MNKMRRKRLGTAHGLLEEAKMVIEEVREQEEDYMEGMTENAQSGDKGCAAAETINSLEEAISNIEGAIDSLNEIQ